MQIKKEKNTFYSNLSRSLVKRVSCESTASRLCISHGRTFRSVLMLSSGLWSPFNYTRRAKRWAINYLYGRDTRRDKRCIWRGEERRGEEGRGETARCGFKKEMRDGGGEESGCRKKRKQGKRGWARSWWRAECVKANTLWGRWSGYMTPGLWQYSEQGKGSFPSMTAPEKRHYVWKKHKKGISEDRK